VATKRTITDHFGEKKQLATRSYFSHFFLRRAFCFYLSVCYCRRLLLWHFSHLFLLSLCQKIESKHTKSRSSLFSAGPKLNGSDRRRKNRPFPFSPELASKDGGQIRKLAIWSTQFKCNQENQQKAFGICFFLLKENLFFIVTWTKSKIIVFFRKF